MKFEIVSKYADADLSLPIRKTKTSAGYDFQVAEDTVIPSYQKLIYNLVDYADTSCERTLEEIATFTKATKAKPTLVPTGIKCEMPEDFYLELSVRSSCPLKHWLILANGVGIIDSDYYNNPDNEGHIFFQVINLSPFDIILKKGDTIGQGILKKYFVTDNDVAYGERAGGFGSTDNIINALCDAGHISNILTPDEWLELGTKLNQPDKERVYTGNLWPEGINVTKEPEHPTPLERYQEEYVMACNPERRAYVFGVDLAPGAETL